MGVHAHLYTADSPHVPFSRLFSYELSLSELLRHELTSLC